MTGKGGKSDKTPSAITQKYLGERQRIIELRKAQILAEANMTKRVDEVDQASVSQVILEPEDVQMPEADHASKELDELAKQYQSPAEFQKKLDEMGITSLPGTMRKRRSVESLDEEYLSEREEPPKRSRAVPKRLPTGRAIQTASSSRGLDLSLSSQAASDSDRIVYDPIKPFVKESAGARIDIRYLYDEFYNALESWWNRDSVQMKMAILQGNNLNTLIKEARERGSGGVSFEGLRLNISQDGSLISSKELTKSRFYAILHMFLDEKRRAATREERATFFLSPLIHKIVMDETCPLFTNRYLIGSGYQYMHREFGASDGDKILYIAGAITLDYLSSRSERSPRFEDTREFVTLMDYAQSMEVGKGEMVISGSRNMGDSELKILYSNVAMASLHRILSEINIDLDASGSAAKSNTGWRHAMSYSGK